MQVSAFHDNRILRASIYDMPFEPGALKGKDSSGRPG